MALNITPSVGPIFWFGDSEIDELNFTYQGGLVPTNGINGWSDGHSFSYLTNSFFGQGCAPIYTPSGGNNKSGQNYAFGGNTWGSFNQYLTLATNYPSGLPPKSVCVVSLGINDVDTSVSNYGGVWQTSPQTWMLGPSGGFTVPALNANIQITTTSTTGMVAGATNGLAFQSAGVWYGPFWIVSVDSGTLVTIKNGNGTLVGGAIPNSAPIKIAGAAVMDNSLSLISTATTSLLTSLGSTGLLVLISPPNTGLLPGNATVATLSTATWNYYRANTLAPSLTTSSKQVTGWDMNSVMVDVITNNPPANGIPNRYGMKNVSSGWGWTLQNNPYPATGNPMDYAFCDIGFHFSSALQALMATRFFEFLRCRLLLSPY